jgi:DNA polymerase III epsilon subunit-like protein
MDFKHIMLDTETLGTAADSVILSIGAVRFDLDSDRIDDAGFYASISIDSNLDYKRRIQEDTLMWWFKQDAAAQAVFFEPKETLSTALENFSDWLGDRDNIVWSMGADFDLPMVAHAYHQHSSEVPWKFWNSRCARTYKTLPQATGIKVARAGTHHNALADAIYQAQLVQAIHRKLAVKSSMVKA